MHRGTGASRSAGRAGAAQAGNCSFLREGRACGSRHAGGEGRVPGGAAQARAAVGGGRRRHGAVQAEGAAPQVGVAGEAGGAAAGGVGGGPAARGDPAAARGDPAAPALAPRRRILLTPHEQRSSTYVLKGERQKLPSQPSRISCATAQDLTFSIFSCKWYSSP